MSKNDKNELDFENMSVDELLIALYNANKAQYSRLNKINEVEFILIDKMLSKGLKTHETIYDNETKEKIKASLVFYANNLVDYEKMKKLYPEVYNAGIIPSFSFKEAIKTVDSEVVKKVIRDCTVKNPKYKIKYKRGK